MLKKAIAKALLGSLARHLATLAGGAGVIVSDDWATTTVSVLVALAGYGWSVVRAKRST